MSKTVDVIIFVEHPSRELQISKLIKSELEDKYRLEVVIASLIFEPVITILKYKPQIIVTPSTSFGRGSVAWLFSKVYGDDMEYVNMNYEQYIHDFLIKHKISLNKISRSKQKHLVWGRHFSDLLANNGINNKNIYITGRPHTTIIKNLFTNKDKESRLMLSQQMNLNKDDKWLFIALTDGFAFMEDNQLSAIARNVDNDERFVETMKYVQYTIPEIFKWISLYLRSPKTKNIKIIMRPHPSISVDAYRKLFKKLNATIDDRVLITKDFTAYDWISASDIFITNFSTLAVEAKILSKRSFVIKPKTNFNIEKFWWTEDMIKVSTSEEFVKELGLERVCEREYNYNIDFYDNKSYNGIEKSAEIINSFVKKDISRLRRNILKILLLVLTNKRLFGSVLRYYEMKFGFKKKVFTRPGIINDFFEADELEVK